eukprot:gene7609-9358_t
MEEECSNLLELMKKFESTGQPFYPRDSFRRYTFNIIMKYMISNIRKDESDTEEKLQNIFLLMDQALKEPPNPLEYIKFIIPFFILKFQLFSSPVRKITNFVRELYLQHIKHFDPENPRDLLDTLIIEYKERNWDPELSILVALDFLIGGTDTSSSTSEWFLLYMSNYKEIQEKAFEELIKVLGGKENKITLNHRQNTPYLNAIIKEVMRIRSVVPLGLPRSAKNDIIIDDGIKKYFIPKDAQIIPNIKYIHSTNLFWDEPEIFNPSRFLQSDDKCNENFFPFSLGLRNCVGQQLAIEEMSSRISLKNSYNLVSPKSTIPTLYKNRY